MATLAPRRSSNRHDGGAVGLSTGHIPVVPLPGAAIFTVLFIAPTFASFYFAFTRWTLFDVEFIGIDNFVTFFSDPQLSKAFANTLIYGVLTSVAKVVLGLPLGVLLTSDLLARGYLRAVIFFPVLVSTVGVGITFQALMDPYNGAINGALALVGVEGPGWLTDPTLALYSIIRWTSGRASGWRPSSTSPDWSRFHVTTTRPPVDGATGWTNFRHITLPLVRPATTTVIILSLIGGLRSFELIWAIPAAARVSRATCSPRSSTSSTPPGSTDCRPQATSSCSCRHRHHPAAVLVAQPKAD